MVRKNGEMIGHLQNEIFKDTADMFLLDEIYAETKGMLDENSNVKCKKVFLSGENSHTTKDFMEEVYNKLNFPSFFGRNWSAFHDSYKEKLWIDEDNFDTYLLVFRQADKLLSQANETDLEALLETLSDIIEALADPESIMPIKIVFCLNSKTDNRFNKAAIKLNQNIRDLRLS